MLAADVADLSKFQ